MTETYREWTINPCEYLASTWYAYGPGYDADWDGERWVANAQHLTANSIEDLKLDIDDFITENAQ